MALIFADPFSTYDAATQYARLYAANKSGGGAGLNGTVATGAYGPDGGPGLRFSGDGGDGLTVLAAAMLRAPSGPTFIFQGHLNISANASSNVVVGPRLSGAAQCSLAFDNGTFRVYRGDASGTLLGSVAYGYTLGTFVYVRYKAVIDSTAGSVRVDIYDPSDLTAPVATLTLTSVNTQAGASETWDAPTISAACAGTTDFANCVVMDGTGATLNDVIAPTGLTTRYASSRAAGALTDWTLSTGSDPAALLDETPPDDDTTYIGSSTLNQQTSVFADLVSNPRNDILGAALFLCAKLTSGTPAITPIARQDGTVQLGTAFSPGASYAYAVQPYSTLPDGSAFGAAAQFDAIEWGVKLTSAGGARVTQLVVVVLQLLTAPASRRDVLLGSGNTASGDDNFLTGQRNAVTGTASQAHGVNGTVTADRGVLYSLDGNANTLTEPGKMKVGGKFEATDTTTVPTPVNPTDAARKDYVDAIDVLPVRTADPASPVNGTFWLFDDGGSPASLSLRWRKGGVTYDFPIGTATT